MSSSDRFRSEFYQELERRNITISSVVYEAGTTRVYKGLSAGSEVAIKLQWDLTDDTLVIARSEYDLQMLFQAHPNVVQIYEKFEFSIDSLHAFVLVEEWLSRSLNKEINRKVKDSQKWTDSEVVNIGRKMLDLLAEMQRMGIAHRDVKPQNILLTKENEPKLGDFGSAKRMEEDVMCENTVGGTPFYMSPELRHLMSAKAISGTYNPAKADVYSLGLTLMHLHHLKMPISLLTLEDIETHISTELQLVESPDLHRLLTFMLVPNPAKRLDSAELQVLLMEKPSTKRGKGDNHTVTVLDSDQSDLYVDSTTSPALPDDSGIDQDLPVSLYTFNGKGKGRPSLEAPVEKSTSNLTFDRFHLEKSPEKKAFCWKVKACLKKLCGKIDLEEGVERTATWGAETKLGNDKSK